MSTDIVSSKDLNTHTDVVADTTSANRGIRDKYGRFVPGNVSNPSGRPKIDPTLREAAKALTQVALDTLNAVCSDSKAPPAARVSAACAILDRGHGKPLQSLEVTTIDDGGADVRATLARLQANPSAVSALLTLAEVAAKVD